MEPSGDERGDYQAGVIAATVANVHRDPDKKSDPYTPDDFKLNFEPAEMMPKPDWRQQLAQIELINAAMGGQDLRGTHA